MVSKEMQSNSETNSESKNDSLDIMIEEENERIEHLTKPFKKSKRAKPNGRKRSLPKIFQQIEHDKRIASALNMFSGNQKDEVCAIIADVINDHVDFIALDDTKELLYYEESEGIWCFGAEIYIEQTIRNMMPKSSRYYLNEIMDMIRTQKDVYQPRSLLDSGNYLATRNTVIKFNNKGKIKKLLFTPELYLTKKINAKFDPSKDCPEIKQFLNEVTNENGARIIIEMVGMSLYKGYPIHNYFIFRGSQDAGKDTTLKVIQKLLGEECYSNLSIQDITKDRRMARSLIGKKANICAELEEAVIKDPTILKQLVGESKIEADIKHSNKTFKFQNEATIIVAANKVPPIYDSSGATKGKAIFVEFPNSFHNNPDPDKFTKISTEDELSGFLNLALQGLKDLLKRRRFNLEETTLEERVETYDRFADPVSHFFNKDPYVAYCDGEIKVDDFYTFFLDHCKKHGLTKVDKRRFGKGIKKIMDEEGRPFRKLRRGTGYNRYYVYLGITYDITQPI